MRNSIDMGAVEGLNDPGLITFMGTLHDGISASSVIQEFKWHGDCPRLESLKEHRDIFQAAYNAAIYKDVQKVAIRKEARTKSIDLIKKIANNVELCYWDDTAKIAALGFPVKKPRTTSSLPIGITSSFNVIQGEHRGQAIGKAKPIPGATFYEVRYTQADPTNQEEYRHFDTYMGCSHMEYNGLTPTQQYSFCIRGRSTKKTGPWSSPVTIIAT